MVTNYSTLYKDQSHTLLTLWRDLDSHKNSWHQIHIS